MEAATTKQIIRLKKFVKDNPELSRGLLKAVQFDQLSKQEASELIEKCYGYQNGSRDENGDQNCAQNNDSNECSNSKVIFSSNYKNRDGTFGTATLTEEEIAKVRKNHGEHCTEVWNKCKEEHPNNKKLQLAMFDKRCDHSYTWIRQALEEKVRQCRK